MRDVVPDPHDRLTFHVTSRTEPKRAPYLVELDANGGRGFCTCKDWQTRRTQEGECKHVRRCRALVAAAVLAAARRFPNFGMELHRVVRLEWERALEMTETQS